MQQELSWAMAYEIPNSADTSSLKTEQQGTPAEWSLSLSISAGGDFYVSRALQFGGTETDRMGFTCPEKNIG